MSSPTQLTPAQQAHYERLAPYLPYSVQVYNKAHGIGTLVGLPYCQQWERPRAEVYYPGPEDGDGPYQEVYELEEVELCLKPNDLELWQIGAHDYKYFLEHHVAVGLPAGSYRVLAAEEGKEVAPNA